MSASRTDKQQVSHEDENFISRWSRRKQEVGKEPTVVQENPPAPDGMDEKPLLTDADMPAIETLTEDSDYSSFLSPRVSEALRKQALHKLFHSPGFNIRDGLDDYDGVYTEFEKLGDIVTADMRHQLEMESQRRARQLAEDESVGNNDEVEVAAVTPENNIAAEAREMPEDVEMDKPIDDVDDAGVES